ncbi:MAG: response regulator [Chloroflexi bacterium]|nr:response regulator [Chloroflexota bacterium]
MMTTATTQQTTARVLVITQDAVVKSFINSLLLNKRILAGVTDSVDTASHFLNTNEAPHLVIVDLELPEGRALEFLKQMRRRNHLANIPVLVLTSFPDPEQVREAFNAGGNRYLTKMFMGKNLLSTLREMLR